MELKNTLLVFAYLLLFVLIYLFFGDIGLTVVFAIIYFPMIFYSYLVYVPINFWKKFWRGKPKFLLSIFQIAFYSIFYIFFTIFFTELFHPQLKINLAFKILGILFLTISLIIQFKSMKKMNLLRTTFLCAIYRHQTKETTPLVTSGIYKFVRNPMYTTDVIILISVFLITGTYFSAFLAILYVIQLYPFVKLEEKELIESYGDSYLRYCKETPRFIPNISNIFSRKKKKE